MKYNEIIEKVEVTEEMRKRILSNISEYKSESENALASDNISDPDRTSEKRKKILTFPNRRQLSALAACAVIAFLCVTALPGILNKKQPEDSSVAIVYNITECKDISELSQYAGFEIDELTDIPFDIVESTYTWCFETIAQIDYIGANNSITYRVAESSEDISGDYNDYDQIREEIIQNTKVTIKGTDDKAYLATWTSGKYSYAICSSEGISYTEMMAMIK